MSKRKAETHDLKSKRVTHGDEKERRAKLDEALALLMIPVLTNIIAGYDAGLICPRCGTSCGKLEDYNSFRPSLIVYECYNCPKAPRGIVHEKTVVVHSFEPKCWDDLTKARLY